MSGSRALVGALACLIAVAAARPAAAAADPAQAKAAFEAGQRRFLAGDYREALTWFKQGYLSTDNPAFLLNMAQCQRYLGETKEALMMYRLYLKSTQESANREAHAVATKAIQELESEAASVPTGAAPSPAASPAAATAPPADPKAAARSLAPVRRAQHAPAAYPILDPVPEVDAKRPSDEEPTPAAGGESRARRLRLAGLITGGAGLASLGVGFYYWTRATSLADSANSAAVFNQADYDDGKRAETMQWIFYSVGTAAVATGAALYVYGRWWAGAKKPSVGVAPIVAPGGAGLAAKGAF